MAVEIHKSSHGYTLFEILIVMSIMAVLLAIGAVNYNRYTKRQIIIQDALSLKDALRNTATQASAGEKPFGITCTALMGYEISFSAHSYSVQAVCDPDAPDAPVKTVTLNPLLQFNPIPDPVLFRVLNRGIQTPSVNTATKSATLNIETTDSSLSFKIAINADSSISVTGLQ